MGTKSKIRLLVAIALTGMCLSAPVPSNAAPIPVDKIFFTGTGIGVPNVRIEVFPWSASYITAGFYNVDLTVTADPDWTGSYNGFAFCAQPNVGMSRITTYTDYSLYEIEPPYTGAAWLMSQYLVGATIPYNAASLQVAIWEAILDPGDFDLREGNFMLADQPGNLNPALANSYLAALRNADLSSFSAEAYRIASDKYGSGFNTQDFIIYDPVPIPNAIFLLGSGLIMFIGLGRKLGRR